MDFLIAISYQVRQGIGNKYPSLSTILSFAERGTKEPTLSSQTPSTSKPNAPLMKPKVRKKITYTHVYYSLLNHR